MRVLLAETGAEGLYSLLDRGGVLALLCVVIFVIVIGGMREWYYLRPYVRLLLERIAERDVVIHKQQEHIELLQEDNAAWRQEVERWSGTTQQVISQPRHRPRGTT